MAPDPAEKTARDLIESGYTGLFLSGDRSSADSVWNDGESRGVLEEIVRSERYDDLARILASEVLYRKDLAYPSADLVETLGRLYARALAMTDIDDGPFAFSGNEWGFMYRGDELGAEAHGALGAHLLETGDEAVPYLTELLDEPGRILYEGSHEATLGNSLRYRVKDAAAYYLGKLAGIPVPFHDDPAERDEEIARLRAALSGRE
jgi:hypothetical protein